MNEWDDENDYTLIFDHFYTNNHIQILKTLLPFLDTQKPSYIPVLIKYMELQHTISLVKNGIHPIECGIKASSSGDINLEQIYLSIKKYLDPSEDKSFQQILNMMQTMENVKEMQKMMEFFQSMNGDVDNASSSPFPDLSNMEGLMGGSFNIADIMQLMNNMK